MKVGIRVVRVVRVVRVLRVVRIGQPMALDWIISGAMSVAAMATTGVLEWALGLQAPRHNTYAALQAPRHDTSAALQAPRHNTSAALQAPNLHVSVPTLVLGVE